jgi:DNA-binding transcriptional ArsR family regulator
MPTAQKKPSSRPRRKLAAPNERIVKAMNHPIRFAALSILAERVASPSDLAKELGETVGAVAYHVRILRDLGAIELVETAQRRGATESYYRATVRPWFSDDEYSRLPARRRRELFAPTIRMIVDDAVRALAKGGFDDPRAHASRSAFDVDDEGYDELVALLAETLERIAEIQAGVANRAVKAEKDTRRRTEIALLHFEPTPAAKERAQRGRRRAAKRPQR